VIPAGRVMATRQQRGAPEKHPLEGRPPEEAQSLRAKGHSALIAGARVCIAALKNLADRAAALADLGADLVLKAARAALWILARTWRLLLWPIRTLANLFVSSIALLAALGALYEFFEEAVPYIEPDQVTSTSWHDLPFKAKIDSRIFGAFDVHVLCAANEIGRIGNGVTRVFQGKAFIKVDRISPVIPPHGTITFSCNMAEANAVTAPGDPVAPVVRIELHLLMKYRSFLRPWGEQIIRVNGQRTITSAPFTWREVSPGNYQWLEGEPHGQ
jgi:hypothetical protein